MKDDNLEGEGGTEGWFLREEGQKELMIRNVANTRANLWRANHKKLLLFYGINWITVIIRVCPFRLQWLFA